jgi:hypothetical protein
MNTSSMEEMMQIKQGILLFSLFIQDQGLATAQDSL